MKVQVTNWALYEIMMTNLMQRNDMISIMMIKKYVLGQQSIIP